MIETQSLTMHYGDLVALDGLDLKVEQGEFFAFLGPNAAGKTTTIKLLTGLLQPSQGTAKLCGIDIHEHPIKAKRKLGYVPDVAVFYEKLTALEFMEFTADLFEMDAAPARAETERLFERFDLGPYAGEQAENLSHGTRQRLAIAAALLHDPEVVIIDEPMVGLDPIHARTVKQELRERASQGTTVFMSTHLLNIAEELADRIAVIHHGKLVEIGTLDELRSRTGGSHALEEMFLDMVAAAPEDPHARH